MIEESSENKRPNTEQDIIAPSASADGRLPPALYAEIIAQINQYTERPDLLIDAIERHDPGFVKQLNKEGREFSRRERNSRFHFARIQAYASLILHWITTVFILVIALLAVIKGYASLPVLVGIAILFAVNRAGVSGAMKIVDQISTVIGRGSKQSND